MVFRDTLGISSAGNCVTRIDTTFVLVAGELSRTVLVGVALVGQSLACRLASRHIRVTSCSSRTLAFVASRFVDAKSSLFAGVLDGAFINVLTTGQRIAVITGVTQALRRVCGSTFRVQATLKSGTGTLAQIPILDVDEVRR